MLIILILISLSSYLDQAVLLKYFFVNVTENYLVLDRQSNKDVVSIAATGFGYTAWSYAAKNNIITSEEAERRINLSLDFLEKTNPTKNRGWFYHWINKQGKPVLNREVSSIDTAILLLCLQRAASDLSSNSLTLRFNRLVKKVDVPFMMAGNHFRLGLVWSDDKPMFFDYKWDEYSEGVILYKLFGVDYKPTNVRYDLPLFVYYYPLCFYQDKYLVDNLNKAIAYQQEKYGRIGVTACDGPCGYSINNKNVISPVAIWAVTPYSNEAVEELRKTKKWRAMPSYHVPTGKIMTDRIGIDDGSCLLMLDKEK